MSDLGTWLTNNPEVAKRLRAIDRRYAKARAVALPLAFHAKIEALRKAAADRQADLDALKAELRGTAL